MYVLKYTAKIRLCNMDMLSLLLVVSCKSSPTCL